jgi:hypothetical protein
MRKSMAGLVLAAALTIMPAAAHAGDLIVGTAITGNDYLALSPTMQIGYVMGVLDGFRFAPALAGSNLPITHRMTVCMTALRATNGQYRAITNRYLQANPALWGQGMHTIVYQALEDACQQVGQPLS